MIGTIAAVVLAAGTTAAVPAEPVAPAGISEGEGSWATFRREDVACQPLGLAGPRRQELSTLRIGPDEGLLIFHGVPWRVPEGHVALHAETVLADARSIWQTPEGAR